MPYGEREIKNTLASYAEIQPACWSMISKLIGL